ncbi:MAG: tetratricopeptide repeat protein [Chloroflexi bacterium]|nr:tetratricopeptide repeat protein [Chloroflexota bacterium]
MAEICRRLDGLPLAIELAAARVTVLSPEALLARLEHRLKVLGGEQRGVPDRLKTMRHAIAWSYDLLSPHEQALFRQLSAYTGGFALDAVEAIASDADDPYGPLDALAALIAHSLVQRMTQSGLDLRYSMLETLREYGLERLEAEDELPAARTAHATYVMRLAETAESGLVGPDQAHWLDRLDAEWSNIAGACRWGNEAGQPEVTLRVFGAIWRYCTSRGRSTEGRALLDVALRATSGEDSLERSRALAVAGTFAEVRRDLVVAHEFLEQARAMASRIGATSVEIGALIGLGHVARDRGDFTEASDAHTRAMTLAQETGDRRQLASALANMAAVAYYQGDTAGAERHWEDAREIVAVLGDRAAEAVLLGNLGALASSRAEYSRAVALQERALELGREIGDRPAIAHALGNLAEQLLYQRDYATAETCLLESLPILRELGLRGSEGQGLHIAAQLALAQGDLQHAAASLLESTRCFVEIDDELAVTENADILARICAKRGDRAIAIELLAAAEAHRTKLGAESKPVEGRENERLSSQIRQAVSEGTWRRHWRTGGAMSLAALADVVVEVSRSASGSPSLSAPDPIDTLTRREREVLRLLTDGLSTGEIAQTLFISPRTATTHIANIFEKLDVNSRAAAVAYALRSGLAG